MLWVKLDLFRVLEEPPQADAEGWRGRATPGLQVQVEL